MLKKLVSATVIRDSGFDVMETETGNPTLGYVESFMTR